MRRITNYRLSSIIKRGFSSSSSCSSSSSRREDGALLLLGGSNNSNGSGYGSGYGRGYGYGSGVSSCVFSLLALTLLHTAHTAHTAHYDKAIEPHSGVSYSTDETILNWSNTHRCQPARLYEPKNAQEVLRLLQFLHTTKTKARPIGTALSPNGIGMSSSSSSSSQSHHHHHYNDVISLAAIDYIEVDTQAHTVTVGAGARVSDVLKALAAHGLTLANFSSIQEQQLAGWTQIAAHGTGVTLPTVEEMIVRLKLATPTEGLLTLSEEEEGGGGGGLSDLFSFAKAGLGALGVVTELTLRCIPTLTLKEHTYITDVANVKKDHYDLLKTYRHVRYMWLPYTNQVVVVVSNPTTTTTTTSTSTSDDDDDPASRKVAEQLQRLSNNKKDKKGSRPTQAMIDLLISTQGITSAEEVVKAKNELKDLSFTELRDRLLDLHPLDHHYIEQVNKAEAEYWCHSIGSRIGDSTEILGFDCGGQQLVYEVAIPIGSLDNKTYYDVDFTMKILEVIKKEGLPAPCPIEQRWTSRSTATMSPAYSNHMNDVFSWIGIIMYLPPSQSEEQRKEIEHVFQKYIALIQPIVEEYAGHAHWAKIELPTTTTTTSSSSSTTPSSAMSAAAQSAVVANSGSWADSGWWIVDFMLSWVTASKSVATTSTTATTPEEALQRLRGRIAERYPVQKFNSFRKALDPNEILTNRLLDELFYETHYKNNNNKKGEEVGAGGGGSGTKKRGGK
eukprot:scaffold1348_cov184-Ochromonas_danica.AAC.7